MSRPLLTPVPAEPGVYRFRDARGRPLYVGRAVNLRRRVASYWGDLRDRPRLRRMVAGISRVEVLACDSEHEAAWLERNVLQRSKPPWNRMLGGLESPLYLELSDSVAAPHLRTAFRVASGCRGFGPYLSGTKARTAVAALHRLYPLAYTGSRLSNAEREMAVKLAASPDRRVAMVAALCAVLERDAVAVADSLALLRGLRDAASAELAFERAQRLQEEIEALEWICSPQRATVDSAEDLVFHGWAEQTLVRFEVVQGRLSGWQVKACSAKAAEPKLALTPPQWSGFAQRNASLAAALRATED